MQPHETTQGEEASVPAVSGADAGKIARAAFVGTALEWYDYFLFGTAAAIGFQPAVLHTMDPTAATLGSVRDVRRGFRRPAARCGPVRLDR